MYLFKHDAYRWLVDDAIDRAMNDCAIVLNRKIDGFIVATMSLVLL